MLERNPTLKAEMAAMENPEDGSQERKAVPVAFYTYPVMQVANILMPRAHLVPVGEDQLPHIELTRETARRFNHRFKNVFPEPEGLVGRVPRLVGTDGNAKMSKSRGNTIELKDDAETVAEKVKRMYAGPPRELDEPGKVDENPIFMYLDAFDPDTATVAQMKEEYERAGVGNKVLKDRLTLVLNDKLDPFRDRRAKYETNMPLVREALEAGDEPMRTIARETMEMVRDALDLNYLGKYVMLRPTLEEVKALAAKGEGNLVPVYREVTADLETPVSAFLKVRTGQVLVPARVRRGRRTAGTLLVHRHEPLPRAGHRPRPGLQRRPARPDRRGDGALQGHPGAGPARLHRRRHRLRRLRGRAPLRAARCAAGSRFPRASPRRCSCSATRSSCSTTRATRSR